MTFIFKLAESFCVEGFIMTGWVISRKNADVMMRLARIARYCLKQTGIFFCLPSRQAECMSKDDE